jgi:putative lipoprotein
VQNDRIALLAQLAASVFIGLWIAACAHPGDRKSSTVTRAAGGDAPMSKPDASLTETYWKLAQLGGQPAAHGAGGRELHLVLTASGDRVRGFSGCNTFTGAFERRDGQLRFGRLASTGMACLDGMELERRFLDALAGTVRYTLSGDRLTLFDTGERPVLAFDAVYLR